MVFAVSSPPALSHPIGSRPLQTLIVCFVVLSFCEIHLLLIPGSVVLPGARNLVNVRKKVIEITAVNKLILPTVENFRKFNVFCAIFYRYSCVGE